MHLDALLPTPLRLRFDQNGSPVRSWQVAYLKRQLILATDPNDFFAIDVVTDAQR